MALTVFSLTLSAPFYKEQHLFHIVSIEAVSYFLNFNALLDKKKDRKDPTVI